MTAANCGYISSVGELQKITAQVIEADGPIALDCESGYEGEPRGHKNFSPSVKPEENLIAGYSFTNSATWARYVPVGHEDTRYNLDQEESALCLWKMCRTGRVVVHNGEAEERWLSRWMYRILKDHPDVGAEVSARHGYYDLRSDTMMEAHALARWRSVALKNLAKDVLGHTYQLELLELFNTVIHNNNPKTKLAGNKKYTLRFNPLDPSDPRVFTYACDDAIETFRLHEENYPLVKDSNFIYWLEMNVWPVIWEMEDEGLAFDWDMVDAAKVDAKAFQGKMLAGLAAHLTERLDRPPTVNGKPFNPNSPLQLRKVLYDPAPDGLGLRTHIKTKGKADGTGKQMSTNAIALKGLGSDPFVRRLQDYRGMTKLLGTYLEPWRSEYGWCEDGRAHCQLLPHGTVTGRFSSKDFNYQNLPKKYHYTVDDAEFKLNFRDAVISPPGWWGMGFDISQGELRIIAAEAGEQAMLDAFEQGIDMHRLTASRLLHMSPEEVDAGGELFGKEWSSESGGFRSFGKAQPLSTPVLTPYGWRRMGEIKVGDEVVGVSGKPVLVTGVFPQGVKKVYRVTTSDGATTDCCGEHLWTIRNRNSGVHAKWMTRSLDYLLEHGILDKTYFHKGKPYGRPKYELPPRPVVEYARNEILIDPYVMGLLLGDGGFTHTVSFTNADDELLEAVVAEHSKTGGSIKIAAVRDGTTHMLLNAAVPHIGKTNVIRNAIRDTGLLGLKSSSKFVPQCYMRSSPENRLSLLQGLLDTDGNVLASGAEFKVTSEQLARDAQEIVRSLGGWASIRSVQPKRSKFHLRSEPRLMWKVYLRLPEGVCPFRLRRKTNDWKSPVYRAHQSIVSVEEVMPSEVQCISVDAKDGLYVTSDYIVTHNTMNFALMPSDIN